VFSSITFVLEKNTKTLLLDLDETLITSCSKRDGPDRILIPEGDRAHPVREYSLLTCDLPLSQLDYD